MEEGRRLPENIVVPDENAVDQEEIDRQRWSSRSVFILAAIGSAVGLGNVWRFPYLVTKYGGGTFLIPYLICLVFIGMPILLMELALGQVFQGGDVEAFGALNPRCRGIGLMSIFSTFIIIGYYAVINTWSLCYTFVSMGSIPWTTVPDSSSYFYNDFLEYSSIKHSEDGTGHGSDWNGSWKIIMGMFATWLCIYLCVFKGVRSAGEAVKFTMPIPIVLLLMLLFAAVTKPGADDGLDQYIGHWSTDGFKTQADGSNVWTAATGQVFFSLGVTMGVMTAYSSFNPENQNIVMDEKFISLGDFFIAFCSGFTIYSLLGHTVYNCNNEPSTANITELYGVTDNCDELYEGKSLGLAFIMFPYGLSTIPGGHFWCVCFFSMLFLLGIDSAFSMIEAITTVVSDMELAKRLSWSKPSVTQATCLVCFMFGTIYTMDTGLDNFDIVDHYVNTYNLLTCGFVECYATAWIYKIEDQIARVGERCVYTYNALCLMSLIVAVAIGFGSTQLERNPGLERDKWNDGALDVSTAGLVGTLTGLGLWGISTIIGYCLAEPAEGQDSALQILWGMGGWPGPDFLRTHVNAQHHEGWTPNTWATERAALFSWTTIPCYWGFFIKYLIPTMLMTMLANGIREDYYTPYGGFTTAENGIGLACYIIGVIMMITPVFCPVVFMSNKEARKFEGWDLMIALGFDPKEKEWLGFYPDEQTVAITADTKEDVEKEGLELQKMEETENENEEV